MDPKITPTLTLTIILKLIHCTDPPNIYHNYNHTDPNPKSNTIHPLTLIYLKQYKTRSSAIAEGPCDASCQLKSCQLPHDSAETTYTTSPDQIDGMKLEI